MEVRGAVLGFPLFRFVTSMPDDGTCKGSSAGDGHIQMIRRPYCSQAQVQVRVQPHLFLLPQVMVSASAEGHRAGSATGFVGNSSPWQCKMPTSMPDDGTCKGSCALCLTCSCCLR